MGIFEAFSVIFKAVADAIEANGKASADILAFAEAKLQELRAGEKAACIAAAHNALIDAERAAKASQPAAAPVLSLSPAAVERLKEIADEIRRVFVPASPSK